MEDNDIDLKDHKATHIKNSNIIDMDLILCATTAHQNKIKELFPNINSKKIYTIKQYAKNDYNDLNLADPWGRRKERL
jgi:protein-tyrosine-phosphatase